MTQTAIRTTAPAPGRVRPNRKRGSVVVSGCLSALTAIALGLLVCLTLVVIGWATDAQSSGTAVSLSRSAGQLWLLAHHMPLEIRGGQLAIAPMGLTAAMLLLIARSARASIRRTRARGLRDSVVAALAVAPPYALLGTVVAAAARTPSVRPQTSAVLVTALILGSLAALAGAVSEHGWAASAAGLRLEVAAVVRATAAAVAALVCAGAVVVAFSFGSDAATAGELWRSIARGAPSGFALLVAQIALVPNAVVWGSAYVVGSGFAVGVGTQVDPGGSTLSAVPSLPLLAALPQHGGAAPMQGMVFLALAAAAGVVTALVLARQLRGMAPHVVSAYLLAVAVATGIVMAALCWLASGSAPGRLASLGPSPAQTAAAVTQWIALAGAPVAWLAAWRAQRAAVVTAPAG
jgi:hypothetical protein